MSNKYRHDHRSSRNRKRGVAIIAIISVCIVGFVAILIVILINQTTKKISIVNGPAESVSQTLDPITDGVQHINEASYSFALPAGWHQTKVVISSAENSITWQSFVKDATNRYLTIYTSPIPPTYAVNRELPVFAHGDTLSFGSLSDNCADFTNSGSSRPLVPVLAKWQDVNFYCNSPNFVDNVVGTGSQTAINSVTLSGPTSGAQQYFFLYIDRNISPDYTIFYSILNSFRAK